MTENERIEWLVSHAPELTEEDMRKVNAQYTSYLFRRNRTGELFTSCCGQKVKMDEEDPFRRIPHEPEPHISMYRHEQHTGVKHPCPCCGQPGWVKEIGRTGRRDNLFDYRRCVVFKYANDACGASA